MLQLFPKGFIVLCTYLAAFFGCIGSLSAAEYALTIDDPNVSQTALFLPKQRNQRILNHLKNSGQKALLFVCGKRINNPLGKALLRSWGRAGHFLANHSYSHRYFHSSKLSLKQYQLDMMRNHQLLSSYPQFLRFFRFPYLKEGNTIAKRDGMRKYLRAMKYRNGHVTIDASDWYINLRLKKKLKDSKAVDLKKYRDYYLQHMWKRAQYYNGLSKQLFQREVKHTILIHHNLLSALFLGDLIQHFKSKGWKLIDADKAYQDKLFQMETKGLPSGESLLWSLAKERKYKGLRYPAESARYEKAKMDKLGL